VQGLVVDTYLCAKCLKKQELMLQAGFFLTTRGGPWYDLVGAFLQSR